MVNPDSDLYRAHPDWVIHFPTRQRTELRSQLILNLGRTDVQEYLIDVLDKLLSRAQHRLHQVGHEPQRQRTGLARRARRRTRVVGALRAGLYRVWGTLAQRHPQVLWQSCSGGGGRVDYGMLRMVDQFWVSDNTEATARLGIQEGFSQVMPGDHDGERR
jgi:alpha-galactosidase